MVASASEMSGVDAEAGRLEELLDGYSQCSGELGESWSNKGIVACMSVTANGVTV